MQDRGGGGSRGGGAFVTGEQHKSAAIPHIVDAFSIIQRYYVQESQGEDLRDDAVTAAEQLALVKTGLGAGFYEGFFLGIFMLFTLPLLSDPWLRQEVARVIPIVKSDMVLWFINMLPIISSVAICTLLSKYNIGTACRKCVRALLAGRIMLFVFKGILFFWIFMWLGKNINQYNAWSTAGFLTTIFQRVADSPADLRIHLYYFIMRLQPTLLGTAFELVFIFTIALFIPIFTVWVGSWARNYKTRKEQALWEG